MCPSSIFCMYMVVYYEGFTKSLIFNSGSSAVCHTGVFGERSVSDSVGTDNGTGNDNTGGDNACGSSGSRSSAIVPQGFGTTGDRASYVASAGAYSRTLGHKPADRRCWFGCDDLWTWRSIGGCRYDDSRKHDRGRLIYSGIDCADHPGGGYDGRSKFGSERSGVDRGRDH